jgi:hypothetical protein
MLNEKNGNRDSLFITALAKEGVYKPIGKTANRKMQNI